ncbi:Protein zds1 [Sphaceloma murrayae]|uniref:Protein zds1 n=1 Tax=Sphaceloma murrayae TaxID=2082308 RepID=A0A2K1QHK4_9PEZI|nr:Protein zds1 [Sphaceloma murrayae]
MEEERRRKPPGRIITQANSVQPTTTTRPLGSERHTSRRGHAPQISISDTDHHVTEAIGGMYGSDDDDYPSPQQSGKSRPLSFMTTPKDYEGGNYFDKQRPSPPRSPHSLTAMQDRISVRGESSKSAEPARKTSLGHGDGSPISPPPTLSRSSSSDTAVQQFPLNDIDYESSPAAVAQELSNLQAIRRMSMNVDTADPDLPSFSPGFGIPALPPSHSSDEDDPSKLFWVPARLHPELAPKEFKTFIEDRVEKMKRLSDEGQIPAPNGLERQVSGGIKRKKSMLSRQINTDKGYQDGADRLERKRSESGEHGADTVANLAELEMLVNDPQNLMRKLSIDTVRRSQDSAIGVPTADDMPIMPGMSSGLKRSRHTAYRRGSLRKGERAPASRRAVGRHSELDDSPAQSPVLGSDEPVPGISRVRTEPMSSAPPLEPAENFSRPGRRIRPPLGPSTSSEDHVPQIRKSPTPEEERPRSEHSHEPKAQQFHSRLASGGWTTAQLPGPNAPVPHIIETPPPPEPIALPVFPERKSSIQQPPQAPQTQSAQRQGPLIQGARTRQLNEEKKGPSTLDDISSHPSQWPGSGGSRTDELTQVPTFDNKKAEAKTGRKTSWNWLTGGAEKDKEKEKSDKEHQRERDREREREKDLVKQREKDEKEKEKLRKPKISSKLASSDKTRLDVLQTSIDSAAASRGRESLVLNREDIKLEEERKKESSRKSGKADEGGKSKDGLLSAIFGGGKRSKSSSAEEAAKKRHSNRSLSPEPPPRVLKPDIDYNWTRFSILEERAIYRMAHIKLANPKRALYSQVLLSNFMYSYLAKVQMMHPQMQLAQQPQRKEQQQPQQQQQQQQQQQPQGTGQGKKKEERSEEFVQYQRWQEQQARLDSEPTQAAETGSLAGRRSPEGAYGNQSYGQQQQQQQQQHQHQQHQHQQNNGGRGMNGGGDHYGGYGGAGGGAGAVGGSQQYETDFLGYGKNQQLFEDDEDRWDEGENMFEGLSNR